QRRARRCLVKPAVSILLRGLLILAVLCQPLTTHAAAQRIASLNLCLDQLLLAWVPRQQIASVTYLSTDPQLSTIAAQLDGIHINHGLAEELIPLQPDLIVAGEFGAGDAVRLLQHFDYRVERIALPRTLDDIIVHMEALGELVGAQAQAAVMIDELREELAALDAQPVTEKTAAIWYSPNGIVAGRATLEHELMERAGFRNLAAEQGAVSFAQMDLEQLVAAQPEAPIAEGGYVQAFSVAREYLEHPALLRSSRMIELPAALSVCSAPVVADVLRVLREQRVAP